MKCKCGEKAVFEKYCREHFVEMFEAKVFDCIEKYKLILPTDKVCVAVSGGKDSLTVLYLVKKWFSLKKLKGEVSALLIDEGIRGYRGKTILDSEKFCKAHGVELVIIKFGDEFEELDVMLKKKKVGPCALCGTLRRYLLNKHARGYDKIVTGHNLDDEAQAFFMNVIKAQVELSARLGPMTGVKDFDCFVQRVKPLYFCTEKEVTAYAFLHGFVSEFTECPYAAQGLRSDARSFLNWYEARNAGSKKIFLERFLSLLPKLKEGASVGEPLECEVCGEPSVNEVCGTCVMVRTL